MNSIKTFNNVLARQGFTYEQLMEKVKLESENLKLKEVEAIDNQATSTPVHIEKFRDENVETTAKFELEQPPQPIFKPEFEKHQEAKTIDEYLHNFYCDKENDIHKLLNNNIDFIKTIEFLKSELNNVKIRIEKELGLEVFPNLVVETPDKDIKDLTCIKIDIPFLGDIENLKYFNLLEIIPKEDNIKFISQFHTSKPNTLEAEIIIESEHIEYMVIQLKERIFNEEKRIHDKYDEFLNIVKKRIEAQFNKAEKIKRILFDI